MQRETTWLPRRVSLASASSMGAAGSARPCSVYTAKVRSRSLLGATAIFAWLEPARCSMTMRMRHHPSSMLPATAHALQARTRRPNAATAGTRASCQALGGSRPGTGQRHSRRYCAAPSSEGGDDGRSSVRDEAGLYAPFTPPFSTPWASGQTGGLQPRLRSDVQRLLWQHAWPGSPGALAKATPGAWLLGTYYW